MTVNELLQYYVVPNERAFKQKVELMTENMAASFPFVDFHFNEEKRAFMFQPKAL